MAVISGISVNLGGLMASSMGSKVDCRVSAVQLVFVDARGRGLIVYSR